MKIKEGKNEIFRLSQVVLILNKNSKLKNIYCKFQKQFYNSLIMQSIFNTEAYQNILNRIETLNHNTASLWGKMNVGQMAHHCQAPLNIMMQKKDYKLKPSWLIKTFFKKSLYNDKPWRKNLPTASKLKVTDNKDFLTEKEHLVQLINELYSQKEKKEWSTHPTFGVFTVQQWGQMQYKHLDHHLKQFGA